MHHSPRARIAGLAAVAVSLLAPSGAFAKTFVVDPTNGSDNCAADKCKTISQAIAAAATGDTVSILKGTFAESPTVPADKDGLIIKGAGIGDVKIAGTGTGDVLTLAGADTTVSDLTIDVPTNAGSAILVQDKGTTVSGVAAQRNNSSNVDDPVIDVTAAGGLDLSKALIVQNAGATGTPAIRSAATAGSRLSDAVVLSTKGPALVLTGSESNRLTRTTLVSSEQSSDAVSMTSADDTAANKKLVADSSILVGGAKAGGLLVKTTSSDAGDVVVDLRHVTIAGAAKGITLDATGAEGPGTVPNVGEADPAGNITATVTSSIVHGASTANQYNTGDGGLLTASNSVKLTYASSDAPAATGNGTIAMGGASNTEDAKIFAPGKLTQRADSPLIDKGSAPVEGESSTDVEGEPRVAGGASDIGADEYVNKPPTARFGITNSSPRQNEAIGFISGSTDPEQGAGGGISEYRWDFGDGVKETTKVGGVAHAYANPGTYRVTLVVVDNQGAASAPAAPQTVTVRDGIPPTVKVTAPASGAKLALNPKAKKPRNSRRKPRKPAPLPLTMLGGASDASGIQKVELSLLMRGTGTSCRHYKGRVFVTRTCDKIIWLAATLNGNDWTLTTRKGLRLKPGRYELRVRATDGTGLVSAASSAKDGTLIKFRVT